MRACSYWLLHCANTPVTQLVQFSGLVKGKSAGLDGATLYSLFRKVTNIKEQNNLAVGDTFNTASEREVIARSRKGPAL